MNFIKKLGIDLSKKECICIVGAGGKTSAMYTMSKELKKADKTIVVTTTTKIYNPDKKNYDILFIDDNYQKTVQFVNNIQKNGVYLIASGLTEDSKLKGLTKQLVCEIVNSNNIDIVLIEADGAKGKPIKAPNIKEPVIPYCTTTVIGVIGLDSIGKIADDTTVHRLEEFFEITGCRYGDIINIQHLISLIKHECGVFKSCLPNMKKVLLLNKADDLRKMQYGREISKALINSGLSIFITRLSS